MSEFFTETPFVAPTPTPKPGEVARGPSWYVVETGSRLTLHYLTGELVERPDEIEIERDDLDALRSGKHTVAEIVLAHGQ